MRGGVAAAAAAARKEHASGTRLRRDGEVREVAAEVADGRHLGCGAREGRRRGERASRAEIPLRCHR